MSLKPQTSQSSQAERLIDHARKISQELYKFSVELTEQNREKAQQKLNYGKQVLNSLEQLPSKYFNSPNSGTDILNIIYINYISVKPNLENALNDLQKRIEENQYFTVPNIENENDNEENKEKPLESDWKSASELNEENYSSFLKNLIHAAELEIKNSDNSDNDEEEAEEESEAESEEDNNNDDNEKSKNNTDEKEEVPTNNNANNENEQ